MDQFEDTSDDEVDHAFYESDFGEEKKTEETGEYIEKGSTKVVLSDPDLIASSKDTDCCEEENEEKQEDLQKSPFLEDSTDNPGDASSFSLPPVCENAGTSGATSAASRRMQENVPPGSPEINYYTDEEDSSDDDRKQKIRPESAKQSYNVGRASRTYSTTSSSSSSSSSDTDTDSSSSDSLHSSSKRNACSVILPSPKQKCASAIKLPEGKMKLGDHVEESENAESKSDSSSNGSHDGVDLNQHVKAALQLENEELRKLTVGHPAERTRENISTNEEVKYCCDFKAALELKDKQQRKLGIIHPARGTRKNYSFTNDEVRRIDQENQRLLQELARLCASPGSRTNMLKKSASPSLQVYHSAINRQKEQRRIEKENLALLKRLTAVKPTPGMKRSEQLWDYQRYVSYASTSPSARGESSLSRQRGLSRASSRACTASSTMRQKKEKPVSVLTTGLSQRPKSDDIHAACLKCKQRPLKFNSWEPQTSAN
ncbi:cilia- and flagella-associated protein 97 isoform X1 [Coturnix japonica]|uniref:cilia- and flagella-associated protein 97 isoform X1 n=1 Tax=Coturnix japonica TaxID=93934 RepID=UPI000777AB1B|nr:cilia- and flagella-associated protein 97 isoform X1 [Coturnix japonica]XP_015716878.1 cilia- and flagella-associated protein 97 isoform X1 [Coturnix japonica]XP_015716880.1 cilia- and flagella-associated protein 97 isoform X1 [Coturnix japonica]XP_032300445.1 cilia- and flagella-associated protein 97 isoform X1 [Coturnix japonica]